MVGRSLPWLDMMTRTPLSPTIDRELPCEVTEPFVMEHARCDPAPRGNLETLDG
jgi:hypothetical protein